MPKVLKVLTTVKRYGQPAVVEVRERSATEEQRAADLAACAEARGFDSVTQYLSWLKG